MPAGESRGVSGVGHVDMEVSREGLDVGGPVLLGVRENQSGRSARIAFLG